MKKKSVFPTVYLIFVTALMYLPIIIVMIYSFVFMQSRLWIAGNTEQVLPCC